MFIFWSSIPCVYTLLEVVGYYDLSVLAMSVMDFPTKKVWMGVGGWDELYPICFGFWILFNFAKPLKPDRKDGVARDIDKCVNCLH